MGGEGFMEKLKMLLMGSGGSTAPAEPTSDIPPWETPIGPPPMPRRPMPSTSPSPEPMGMQDDIASQVQALQRQRDIAKRLIPQDIWNK